MGDGYEFTCSKCGKKYAVCWGIGFMYPEIFSDTLKGLLQIVACTGGCLRRLFRIINNTFGFHLSGGVFFNLVLAARKPKSARQEICLYLENERIVFYYFVAFCGIVRI